MIQQVINISEIDNTIIIQSIGGIKLIVEDWQKIDNAIHQSQQHLNGKIFERDIQLGLYFVSK